VEIEIAKDIEKIMTNADWNKRATHFNQITDQLTWAWRN